MLGIKIGNGVSRVEIWPGIQEDDRARRNLYVLGISDRCPGRPESYARWADRLVSVERVVS